MVQYGTTPIRSIRKNVVMSAEVSMLQACPFNDGFMMDKTNEPGPTGFSQ